jgi:hypothetical protein
VRFHKGWFVEPGYLVSLGSRVTPETKCLIGVARSCRTAKGLRQLKDTSRGRVEDADCRRGAHQHQPIAVCQRLYELVTERVHGMHKHSIPMALPPPVEAGCGDGDPVLSRVGSALRGDEQEGIVLVVAELCARG